MPSRAALQSPLQRADLLRVTKLLWSLDLWRRLFWLTMGVVHAPALITALRSWAAAEFTACSASQCAFVAALLALFVLKFLDVPFLRLRLDKRSYIVLCIIIALLHVNVLQPTGEHTPISDYAVLLATTCLIGEVVRRRHLAPMLRKLRSRLSLRCSHQVRAGRRRPVQVAPSSGAVWLDSSRPHCFASLLLTFGLRAPPA